MGLSSPRLSGTQIDKALGQLGITGIAVCLLGVVVVVVVVVSGPCCRIIQTLILDQPRQREQSPAGLSVLPPL